MRHCAGIIYRLPFSTGDAALGGADRRDRGGRPGIAAGGGTLFRRYPLSRNVAYIGTFIGCTAALIIIIFYDPRAAIDDSGVLCPPVFVPISSLVRIENSVRGDRQVTINFLALIIVITIFRRSRCSRRNLRLSAVQRNRHRHWLRYF